VGSQLNLALAQRHAKQQGDILTYGQWCHRWRCRRSWLWRLAAGGRKSRVSRTTQSPHLYR